MRIKNKGKRNSCLVFFSFHTGTLVTAVVVQPCNPTDSAVFGLWILNFDAHTRAELGKVRICEIVGVDGEDVD